MRMLFADEKIDYLQVFTFKKIDDEVLALHHEQEQPPIRCTSKAHSDYAVGFCCVQEIRTPMYQKFCFTERKDKLPVKQSIDNALQGRDE